MVGLCFTGQSADNGAQWISEEGLFGLVANGVYRVAMSLTTDQTTADAIPFIDLVWDNFVTSSGFLSMGGNQFLIDGNGGANGIGRSPGISTWTNWIGPNASGSTQFDAAVGDPSNAGALGIRLNFRLLDVNDDLVSSDDSGTICMASIEVTCFQISALETTQVWGPVIDPSEHGIVLLTTTPGTSSATVNAGSASVQLTPPADGSGELVTLQPDVAAITDVVTPRNTLKFDPIVWGQDVTYVLEVSVRSASGDTDPPDLFTTTFDTPSTEHGMKNYSTRGVPGGLMDLASSPVAGASTIYRAYFNSHNPTAAAFANAQRFRGIFRIGNQADLFVGDQGLDPITIESMSISTVDNLN
jgi:hypothetical protein